MDMVRKVAFTAPLTRLIKLILPF